MHKSIFHMKNGESHINCCIQDQAPIMISWGRGIEINFGVPLHHTVTFIDQLYIYSIKIILLHCLVKNEFYTWILLTHLIL